jgi:hypothetical protein
MSSSQAYFVAKVPVSGSSSNIKNMIGKIEMINSATLSVSLYDMESAFDYVGN